MPAPYRDKHFLEMSPLEYEAWKEENRQKDLQRPGRDALEGVYPEEFIVPGARAAGQALKKFGSAIANKVDMAMRPKVENKIVPDIWDEMKGRAKPVEEYKYAVRNLGIGRGRYEEELEDIKRTGFMMPSPKEVASGRNRKWFSAVDDPGKSHLRVLREKVPANRAVRRKDVEIYNKETGEYEPLKKGGVVKAKSFRGDGIAQRGKTKGRFV